jgi:hypothetical protein
MLISPHLKAILTIKNRQVRHHNSGILKDQAEIGRGRVRERPDSENLSP